MPVPISMYFRMDDLESSTNILKEDSASLKERVKHLEIHARELEQRLRAMETLLASHGIVPPAPEETAPAEPKPVGEPVTFPARTEEPITCPRCGKKQKGNRDACYSCGTRFLYENE